MAAIKRRSLEIGTNFPNNPITNFRKTKIVALRDMEPTRCKTDVNNKTLEEINTFNYLGYNVFHGKKGI
jgi:hypothetical protein